MPVKGKTVIRFQGGAEVWDAADKWAAQTGYSITGQDANSRLYQRGQGFWIAPQMVQVSSTPDGFVLEAWVHVPLFNRIIMLGLMPEDLVIEKGGFWGVIPRNRAREDVNKLLVALDAPLIT